MLLVPSVTRPRHHGLLAFVEQVGDGGVTDGVVFRHLGHAAQAVITVPRVPLVAHAVKGSAAAHLPAVTVTGARRHPMGPKRGRQRRPALHLPGRQRGSG